MFPHKRGDPAISNVQTAFGKSFRTSGVILTDRPGTGDPSFPHKRGDPGDATNAGTRDVVPAQAGVIPGIQAKIYQTSRRSRTSGGDPINGDFNNGATKSFPHKRG